MLLTWVEQKLGVHTKLWSLLEKHPDCPPVPLHCLGKVASPFWYFNPADYKQMCLASIINVAIIFIILKLVFQITFSLIRLDRAPIYRKLGYQYQLKQQSTVSQVLRLIPIDKRMFLPPGFELILQLRGNFMLPKPHSLSHFFLDWLFIPPFKNMQYSKFWQQQQKVTIFTSNDLLYFFHIFPCKIWPFWGELAPHF